MQISVNSFVVALYVDSYSFYSTFRIKSVSLTQFFFCARLIFTQKFLVKIPQTEKIKNVILNQKNKFSYGRFWTHPESLRFCRI